MKATVLYYSRRGKTASYAREIALYLWSKGLHVSLSPLSDFHADKLENTDLLLTGCWTCGWFIVGQHPHRTWIDLSRKITGMVSPRQTLFFTTYKIHTGSMFRKMKEVLQIPKKAPSPELKSKTGRLTAKDKELLDLFIKNNTNHLK